MCLSQHITDKERGFTDSGFYGVNKIQIADSMSALVLQGSGWLQTIDGALSHFQTMKYWFLKIW